MNHPANEGPRVDWSALERMRSGFLAGTAGLADYWRSETDLASYDATFAQRIGWKWDFVLADLTRLGWKPPAGELLDWGCGSGVAGRAFIDHFGAEAVDALRLFDRSPLAMRFAARRARERFPALAVLTGDPPPRGTVLLSHVLTELVPEQTETLLAYLAEATSILWVEPGTYEASLALVAIRERLRSAFQLVAPCLHQGACGLLAPGNEPHWCHHFAAAPGGVFTDSFWGQFAQRTDIDLRSTPLSYLVLDRRPVAATPADRQRVLGRARWNKAEVRYFGCDASGVRERALSKRAHPGAWKAARKERFPSLLDPAHAWETGLTDAPMDPE